ncbi:MAG: addiction module protein [Burkholderiaceae bacterium]
MNARINHILEEALALAPEERSAVVVTLLDSLELEDASAVSQAWADEIRTRKSDLKAGITHAVPWSEAKARLSAL